MVKLLCSFRDDFPPLCRRPKCVKWAIVPPKEVIAASCWSRSATKRTELVTVVELTEFLPVQKIHNYKKWGLCTIFRLN